MKKIVKLTESDLTRIVKRVIQEEQLNEGLNLKSILPAMAIAASLNLSSCKTKSEFESKIPEIESLIDNQIKKADKFYRETTLEGFPDQVEFKKITKLKGPIKKCPTCPNEYYIIFSVNETTDGQKNDMYYVDIYQEDKNGKGTITGVSESLSSVEEANKQIKHWEKYSKWDRYENYGNFIDELDYIRLELETMKNESSGRYDELGISDDTRFSKPSDYLDIIDDHIETLKFIKIGAKDDLKSGDINKKEYDIIINQTNDLISNLEEFKYTIR